MESVSTILRVIDFLHQAGMGNGDVVALKIVVDVNLPIAIDDIVVALRESQTLELKSLSLLRDLTEIARERFGFRVEIHKDKLFPGFAAKRHHAHGATVKEFNAVDVGRADQTAIESIGPPVILAAQDILATAAKRDRPCTMTAHVAEGAQLALLVANDDDGFAGDIHGEITFGIFRQLVHIDDVSQGAQFMDGFQRAAPLNAIFPTDEE